MFLMIPSASGLFITTSSPITLREDGAFNLLSAIFKLGVPIYCRLTTEWIDSLCFEAGISSTGPTGDSSSSLLVMEPIALS